MSYTTRYQETIGIENRLLTHDGARWRPLFFVEVAHVSVVGLDKVRARCARSAWTFLSLRFLRSSRNEQGA